MSLLTVDHLLTVPCDLVRRTYSETPDADGEQTVTEDVLTGMYCEMQLAGTREEQGGAVQITTYRVFLSAGTPLTGWDAIHLPTLGFTLELEGDAVQATSPLTGVSFVEAMARRTDGGEP